MGNEDFEHIRVIGKGSYGEVWLAKHKKDKKQYVLKKMNLCKASKRERKSAEQEAKLLSKLKHPNIVSYKDSFETDGGFLYIAMQYCEGGDLYARLKEQKGIPLEEQQVVEWFVQISMALQYMHERNILHRDLKTQNIFLTKSKIIKVGDLGIARILDSASDMATTLIGTPYYMSPELFANKPYNHKSDVWALGCCVYEMTTLKHAFNAKDMNSLVYKILKGRMPPMPRQYSSDLLTLMRSMLHQDPEKRPSVNRILRDPYIKKNIAIFLENTKKSNRRGIQNPVSISRPASASSVRKVSVPSSLEIGSGQADFQKPKIPESKVKTEVPARPFSNQESHPSQAASEAMFPSNQSSSPNKERPQHKSFLRNHVKNSSTDEKSKEVQISEQSGKSNDLGKPPLSRASVSGPETPESLQLIQTPESLVAKTPLVRKPSSSVELGLAPVAERKEVHVRSIPDEPAQDIQVLPVMKEDISPKKDNVHHKKNFLKNHVKNGKSVQRETEVQVSQQQKGAGDQMKAGFDQMKDNDRNIPEPQKQQLKCEERVRPLPVPSVKSSVGLPLHREEKLEPVEFSRSSSISSSVDSSRGLDGDTPRSLPNLSARQRRRQLKNDSAGASENPNSARIKLRRAPERAESDKVTKSEKGKLSVEISNPSRLKPARQPSLTDSTSSSDDSQRRTERESVEEREAKRENKEINNFISILDSTLQMNVMTENSEEEEELMPIKEESLHSNASLPPTPPSEQPPTEQHIHKSISMPSVETLTNTSRLRERIRVLHRDCIRGVGCIAMKKAYEILNNIDQDEVEPELVNLLGKEKFDEYAGKICQLKFCQEAVFDLP